MLACVSGYCVILNYQFAQPQIVFSIVLLVLGHHWGREHHVRPLARCLCGLVRRGGVGRLLETGENQDLSRD